MTLALLITLVVGLAGAAAVLGAAVVKYRADARATHTARQAEALAMLRWAVELATTTGKRDTGVMLLGLLGQSDLIDDAAAAFVYDVLNTVIETGETTDGGESNG